MKLLLFYQRRGRKWLPGRGENLVIEQAVRTRLDGELSDEERTRLEKRLALVHAQRTKGLGLLQEFKKQSGDQERGHAG